LIDVLLSSLLVVEDDATFSTEYVTANHMVIIDSRRGITRTARSKQSVVSGREEIRVANS
jgi:hypothetical protein